MQDSATADPRLQAPERVSAALFPKVVLSAVLHVTVIGLAGVSMRGCQSGMPGEPGGDSFREVGLFFVDGSDDGHGNSDASGRGSSDQTNSTEGKEDDALPPSQANAETVRPGDVVPEVPPDLDELLAGSDVSGQPETRVEGDDAASLIGPGKVSDGSLSSGSVPPGLIRPSSADSQPMAGGRRGVGTGVPGPGQTAFMDIVAAGKSFVYVVDISSSMGDGGRLNLAKNQLKASLRHLQPNQKFQIVFYSDHPERMSVRQSSDGDMYFATETVLRLAFRKIDSVQPENGTDHAPALREALSMEPDVIYFLTDGETEVIDTQVMRDLKKISPRTTIHVVQLAPSGLTSRSVSWLERLADQFRGQYLRLEDQGN